MNFCTLGELTELISRGITPKYSDSGNYLVLNQKCIRNGEIDFSIARGHDSTEKKVSPDKKIQKFDILVNSTGVGTLGRVSQLREDLQNLTCDSHITIVRPKPNAIHPIFLGYCLSYKQSEIESFAEGTTGQTELSRTSLSKLLIPIIHADQQKSIAFIMQNIDEKIQLNKKMNQVLENIAKAIFKSWFVDFDPVKAKVDGKSTGLPNEISSLFPSEFIESEIGKIPKGWEVSKLANYIDVMNGFAFKSNDYVEKGIFVLRTKNFQNGIVNKLADDVYLSEEFLTTHRQHICKPYDYHLVMVGASIGNRGMIFPHSLPALRNQNMWCFRSKNQKNISQLQVKFYLDTLIGEKMGLATGSAREFFRKGDFQNHQLCFADENIQKKFTELYFPILEKISTNLYQNEILKNISNSLLPKLISGELKVPDAEKFLEEVGI